MQFLKSFGPIFLWYQVFYQKIWIICKQIYTTYCCDPNRYDQPKSEWQWMGTSQFSDLQNWNLTIRWSLVSYLRHPYILRGGSLTPQHILSPGEDPGEIIIVGFYWQVHQKIFWQAEFMSSSSMTMEISHSAKWNHLKGKFLAPPLPITLEQTTFDDNFWPSEYFQN